MIPVSAKANPAVAKKKDHTLDFDPDYLTNELSLMNGEPLQDTSDLNDLGKDSLDTSLARCLQTAAIFNLEKSSLTSGTTINCDISPREYGTGGQLLANIRLCQRFSTKDEECA